MSARSIVLFPDPILRQRAPLIDPVAESTWDLVRDLVQTAKEARAWGLSACQIGSVARVAVVANFDYKRQVPHPDWTKDPLVLCNPIITKWVGGDVRREACLSLPGRAVDVWRPRKVTVSWYDPKGQPWTAVLSGWQGRAVQHEFDHLNGLLIIDQSSKINRMTGEDRRAA